MNVKNRTAIKKLNTLAYALRFLALTSILVTYPYGTKFAATVVGYQYAWIVGAIFSILIYFFIDNPLKDSLNYIIHTGTLKITWKNPKAGDMMTNLAVVGSMLLLLTTGGMSFVANFLISDTVSPTPSIDVYNDMKDKEREDMAHLESLAAGKITSANQAIKEAEAYKVSLYNQAVNTGTSIWIASPKNHLDWAKSLFKKNDPRIRRGTRFRKWVDNCNAALAKGDKAIAGAKASLLAARGINTPPNGENPVGASLVPGGSIVDNWFTSTTARSNLIFDKLWKYLLFTDFVALLVVAYLVTWLVYYKKDGGTLPSSKYDFSETINKVTNQAKDMILKPANEGLKIGSVLNFSLLGRKSMPTTPTIPSGGMPTTLPDTLDFGEEVELDADIGDPRQEIHKVVGADHTHEWDAVVNKYDEADKSSADTEESVGDTLLDILPTPAPVEMEIEPTIEPTPPTPSPTKVVPTMPTPASVPTKAADKGVTVNVEINEGEAYVWHTNQKGELVKMTKRDAGKSIKTFQKRMDKAEGQMIQAKSNDDNKVYLAKQKVYKNNRKSWLLFTAYIKEIEKLENSQ